jgi:hypothetical protein
MSARRVPFFSSRWSGTLRRRFGGPTTVAVDITVGGIAVASETLGPDYDRTFHRGPEACGHRDRVELELVVE